jgi:hypothetical protein
MSAYEILQAAASHMQDRAATYDKPEGERSMGATVKAFQAITGHDLTEEQGWLFMQVLKAVRSQQGNYRADSYEDGAAYVALAGEAAARDRIEPADDFTVDDFLYSTAKESFEKQQSETWDQGEARMDNIGPNGGDGEHYGVNLEIGDSYMLATKNPHKL